MSLFRDRRRSLLILTLLLTGCSDKPAEVDTAVVQPDPAVIKPATSEPAPAAAPPPAPASAGAEPKG
jgi:hypothetical protein